MANLPKLRRDLESNEDVVGCLQILNALLVTDNSAAAVSEVLSTIPLGVIFSCLETDDPEQLSLTCALLDKLLCHLQAPELAQYSHFVELGLQYPRANVVKTCLQALLHLCGEEAVREMILAPTMLHLVTQMLGADDLQCASMATKILLHFSSQHHILEGKLVNEVWLCELNSLMQGQDIVRYRVYDLLVQTCLQGGDKSFLTVSNTGYLDQLVRELDTSDPLVKMNCIELLSSLINSPKGLGFLQRSNVVEKLYQTLLRSEQDVMETIVIPSRFKVCNRICGNTTIFLFTAILKFFGQLCVSLGADAVLLFEKYPNFLHFILEAVLSPQEDTLWGVSVDTFGLLSSTLSGRTLLLSKRPATEKVLRKLGEFISSSSSVIKCRSLRAVTMMVSCVEDCHLEHEQSISRKWFAEIHPNLLQLMLSTVKQPFADLRLAGLALIVELSTQEWGQRQLQACPGFVEYLLDRSSEPDKEGKELKYEVVHRIVGSEFGEAVWGNVDMMKMKRYDKEGPYFHTGDTALAIDGAS